MRNDDAKQKRLFVQFTAALERLDPRQREILRRRFATDGQPRATLQQIGDDYGVSRERIRQLEVKALRKLREMVGSEPLDAARRHVLEQRNVADRLAFFYQRNGYCRQPSLVRRDLEGTDSYHKGVELRLVAESKQELAEIRNLLKAAGFKLGRAFVKGQQLRQPIYGADQVTRFFHLIGGGRIR